MCKNSAQSSESVQEKDILKNSAKFTGKHMHLQLCLNSETLAQVFFCEFWAIFKNTYFQEHLWKAASDYIRVFRIPYQIQGECYWLIILLIDFSNFFERKDWH